MTDPNDEAPPSRVAKEQTPLEWDGVPAGSSSPAVAEGVRIHASRVAEGRPLLAAPSRKGLCELSEQGEEAQVQADRGEGQAEQVARVDGAVVSDVGEEAGEVRPVTVSSGATRSSTATSRGRFGVFGAVRGWRIRRGSGPRCAESRLYAAGFSRRLDFWVPPGEDRALGLDDAVALLDAGEVSPPLVSWPGVHPDAVVGFQPPSEGELDRMLGRNQPDPEPPALPEAWAAAIAAELKPIIRSEIRAALRAEARKREPAT